MAHDEVQNRGERRRVRSPLSQFRAVQPGQLEEARAERRVAGDMAEHLQSYRFGSVSVNELVAHRVYGAFRN